MNKIQSRFATLSRTANVIFCPALAAQIVISSVLLQAEATRSSGGVL